MHKNTSNGLSKRMASGMNRVRNLLTADDNILTTILEDHKPLKELIAIMKDTEQSFERRKEAFADFAPLLLTHAKAEEMSLYEFMKHVDELKTEGFEGQTEHSIADQLCEEIKRCTDPEDMSAKIKVLAELVEHHIKEEENDMFPAIRAKVPPQVLVNLNSEYIENQAEIIAQGQDDAPHEAELKTRQKPH